MGAWHAAGLSWADPRILRRGAVAPRGSAASQPGQFFQDEIATPLGEDIYIRLPEDIPNAAWPHSHLQDASRCRRVRPLRSWSRDESRSNISRALATNPGTSVSSTSNGCTRATWRSSRRRHWHGARHCARIRVFATGGTRLGLRKETLLAGRASGPPLRGFYDECLKGEVQSRSAS